MKEEGEEEREGMTEVTTYQGGRTQGAGPALCEELGAWNKTLPVPINSGNSPTSQSRAFKKP